VPDARTSATATTAKAERALDVLNVLLSDVRYGLGAYTGVYLMTEHGWDPAEIGVAFSAGGLAGLLAQTPIGVLVDATPHKRELIAGAVLVVTLCCLLIPVAPGFWPVTLGAVVGALAGTSIGPALASVSLAMVGPERFARRAGRNEALFHAGNAGVNLLILLLAPFFGAPLLFWLMGLTGFASAVAALRVPADTIGQEQERGVEEERIGFRAAVAMLATNRAVLVFAFAGSLFHMANGPMLAMIAQKLALGEGANGIALTAACAIAAQVVMVPTAMLAGRRADRWGRRPLLLIAFAALVLRGLLASLSNHPAWLIALQALDGVGAGMIGALFPVVVADLTRGSHHFAAAQGAIGTVHGLGGVAGGVASGFVASVYGYDTAFQALAIIATLGAVLFWVGMPETSPRWAECRLTRSSQTTE
jgi:MFS family permease